MCEVVAALVRPVGRIEDEPLRSGWVEHLGVHPRKRGGAQPPRWCGCQCAGKPVLNTSPENVRWFPLVEATYFWPRQALQNWPEMEDHRTLSYNIKSSGLWSWPLCAIAASVSGGPAFAASTPASATLVVRAPAFAERASASLVVPLPRPQGCSGGPPWQDASSILGKYGASMRW